MSEQNTQPKRNNKGYMFFNNNKNKATQPDHSGKFTLDGKEFSIGAWENVASDGRKYFSLSITPYTPSPNHHQSNYQNNYNNNQNKNNEQKNFTDAPISNDFDFDLDQILNQSEDDEPFK